MRRTIRYSSEADAPRSNRLPRRRLDTPTSLTQPAISVPAQSFRALSPDDRAYLMNWSRAARLSGIDAVEDMMGRRWPCPVADVIIGVFRFGEELASWLVIGQDGEWVVACCAAGTVSGKFDSLATVLSRLHSLEDQA
jgi:hypothetical protein